MRSVTLLPILGAISVTAMDIIEPRHMSLISRQLDSSTIPAACQSTCQSAMSIYSDCTSGDTSGCRQVCQQSTFKEFIDCLDCTSEQLAMTTSEQSLLNSAVEQLKDVCGQTGSSVTGTLAPIASGSAAASATSAVSDILSFTSAASGITIGSGVSGTASEAVTTTSSSPGVATNAATSGANSGAVGEASAAYPVMGGKLVGSGVAAFVVIAGALFVL
ncbi:hypothetical protein CNBK0190 [Cryptococcus deneoformans B-3501A]|uniref:hypothetical protein n=1 Tax=Cryptococcus deneoformans (strain B-3501A) TaxID=283643 RepID=UPI000042DF44|nr:hypothetical protein CNBK0190 [Cryptococcus neoformans var. neoformans B-3501A]EAL17998.1 hypothetical protein CNBK0190 [Cryptococcus neoformans var. neoformans B-3501A]